MTWDTVIPPPIFANNQKKEKESPAQKKIHSYASLCMYLVSRLICISQQQETRIFIATYLLVTNLLGKKYNHKDDQDYPRKKKVYYLCKKNKANMSAKSIIGSPLQQA